MSLSSRTEGDPARSLGGTARREPSRRSPLRAVPSARAIVPRLTKFLLVGAVGSLVNSVALFLLFELARMSLVVAAALSVEAAIVNNFLWNDLWTFGRGDLSLRRFARFNLVSLGGLAVATATLWALVTFAQAHYLAANLAGIGLATGWNFVANAVWTWGPPEP